MSPYIVGLDLAPPHESTGLAVVERSEIEAHAQYAVRHLHRLPPATPFAAIAVAVRQTIDGAGLAHPPVIVDLTAVGTGVLSTLAASCAPNPVRPVVLTAGIDAADDGCLYRLPKRDLVTTLQVLLQNRRLRVAADLADANVLVRELTHFRTRTTLATGSDAGPADWRERLYDDLVLAVALACWWGEQHLAGGPAFAEVPPDYLAFLDRVFPDRHRPLDWSRC